jgi:predicted nucleic-acid-binding protein
MSTTYLLDTNILLRFLTRDDVQQCAAVEALFARAVAVEVVLKIPFIAITETVFTLGTLYRANRTAIADEMLKIVRAPGFVLSCPSWIVDALEEYRTKNVSFGDACIAAEARYGELPIASFDKGFKKFADISRYKPR